MASGPPLPGNGGMAAGGYITPQAGQLGKSTFATFFDPNTYRGKLAGLPPMGPASPMTELTQENINRFFDNQTYHGKMAGLPTMKGTSTIKQGLKHQDLIDFFYLSHRGQKRTSESQLPPPHPATKARLGKLELLEKFKLAAELNGVSWDELMVPCHIPRKCSVFSHFKKVMNVTAYSPLTTPFNF